MSENQPSTHYRDSAGNLCKERRKTQDRRRNWMPKDESDRRNLLRRNSDREFMQREHEQMIEEALSDFAAEHQR